MNTVQEYRMPLLFAGVTLVLAILVYALFISPQTTKLSTLDSQATQLQSQATQLQAKLTGLQQQKQKLPANCADLEKISTQIPSVQSPAGIAAEESSFETQLNALLAQTGTAIVNFSGFAPPTSAAATPAPSAAASTTGVVPIPLTLTVTGNFGQLSAFLGQLDNFPRLLVIKTFSLSLGSSVGTANATGGASGSSASNPSAPPLWVGGNPTSSSAGPYSVQISGSIYYTTSPSALSACAKATAAATTTAATK